MLYLRRLTLDKPIIASLWFLLFLSGCASLPPSEEELKFDHSKVVVHPSPFIDSAADYANRFAIMALFAQTAYREDLGGKHKSGHGCDYQKTSAGNTDVITKQMPQSDIGHWERSLEPGSCVEDGGLFYETYVHRNISTNKIDMAVIAFRGTENSSISETIHDWGANLSGIFPFFENEYDRAKANAIPLIDKLLANNSSNGNPVSIYLTGHSLGGGLAQYVAYLAGNKVKATYAFDTSPVTHWFQLPKSEQVRDPVIYRIYQDREALEALRNTSTRFNTTRYHRSDYAFDFELAGRGVKAHNIKHITCGLAKWVSDGKDNLFDYTKASATVTLNSNLCS